MWSFGLAAVLGAFATSVAALDAVEVYGNKFFNKDGSQFFMKGIAYQLRPNDPLIDTEQCKRDVKLMEELGTNTLRVYHVDADANHDGCMSTFADAGIYLLIDLDTFDTYILPENLYWNQTQFKKYAEVIDTFHDYDNVLGFFVGNENIAAKEESIAAPYLKAAARDLKAYRDEKGYRKIPIGYSAADIKELRPMLQDYLTCGGNSSEIIDFFGLNSYSWCDPSTFNESSYNELQEYAKDFPVPIFFTETGCNVPGPRLWDDQDAIFGPEMINDWSGSIVYEWIQEQNHYGIISYGQDGEGSPDFFDGWMRKGTPSPVSPDFNNLKTKWASINPTGVSKKDYNTDHVSTRKCPAPTGDGWWEVNGNVVLPTLGQTHQGTYSTHASATADPSDNAPQPTESSSDNKDNGDDKDGAAGTQQMAAFGASLAIGIFVLVLWL
ncbi:glycoside hydrolase family 72 protein [Sarocladium strictum]